MFEKFQDYRGLLKEIEKQFNEACTKGAEDAALDAYQELVDLMERLEGIVNKDPSAFKVSTTSDWTNPDEAKVVDPSAAGKLAEGILQDASALESGFEIRYNEVFA